jgi:GntR family transcriptional regulator
MDQLRAMVASQRLKPGELVPSVRQLAESLEVNLMTVSKAYARLEAEGVLERDRGIGMRVRAHAPASSVKERQQELRPFAEQLAHRGWQAQLSNEQILAVLHSVLKERAS